jgi:hypothetical protein
MLRITSLVLFVGFAAHAVAQQAPPAADAPVQKPSALVTPALVGVGKAGSGVDLNKWKGSNQMREEVDANLVSMKKDLEATLPPLLDASDAAPASAAAALPVLLNLDALYSVLLRVTVASRSGAPKDQNTQLEQAALTLDNARRDLGDLITATVAANEKKVSALQATVQQQAAALQAAQAPPPSPPPTPPAKAPMKKKKPAAAATKPATTPPAAKPAQ